MVEAITVFRRKRRPDFAKMSNDGTKSTNLKQTRKAEMNALAADFED